MKPAKRNIQVVAIPLASLLLFVCGLIVCLYYGRLGFLPLDQSIVFDGGWRLLSGQIPFKDFTTPAALTPIVLQSLFFRLWGVNWFAYCLHSAVLNGLFCVLVFECLRMLRLPAPFTWLYGLASSLIYYAPIGTPYLEQHGFFFLLLAFFCLLKLSNCKQEAYFRFFCILLSLSLVLSYLSKQNVLLCGMLPLLALFVIIVPREKKTTLIFWSGCGLLIWILAIYGLALAYDVDWGKVSHYFFKLPYAVGKGRLNSILGQLFPYIFRILSRYLISPILLLIAAVSASGCFLAALFRSRLSLTAEQKHGFLLIVFAGILTFSSAIFALSANHHEVNAFPYLFLCLGLLHCGVNDVVSFEKMKSAAIWLQLCLVLFCAYEAYYLTTYFVASRTVLSGMKYQADEAVTPQTPGLRFMKFFLNPRYYRFSAEELDALIAFFDENPGNFLLIGDTSILYGLTGRPSPMPSLWLHQELTIPPPFSPELWEQYQQELLGNIARYQVKYVVLEGQGTMTGVSVHSFPKLLQFLESQPVTMQPFGEFTVLKLFQ